MCVDIKDVSQSKVFFNWAQLLVRVIPLISPSNTPTGVCTAPVCYLGDDLIAEDVGSFTLCVSHTTPLAATPNYRHGV